MKFNFRIIINILGLLLMLSSIFMFFCLVFSIFLGGKDWWALLISALITFGAGLAVWLKTKNSTNKELRKRDGYLIVTSGWLVMSLFGTLPYILSGSIPSFTDAFFETISGFTTTGASILNDIEAVPSGILLWRSLTQWIGGMGIIVLTVAILPILGIGGMQLFVAEAPGIAPDKLKPRIKETAQRLWYIYLGLTVAELILLLLGGMPFFDALNHSLTTMATGGFSTKNSSAAEFTPYVQYVIIVFMFLAGTNFTLTYFGLKGNLKRVWRNEEFRKYIYIIGIFTLIIVISVFFNTDNGLEKSFRDSLFQVVAIITTTGYVSADYTSWGFFVTALIFIMMFIGASAGSTAGGVKIVRHIVLFKNSFLELKRQMHPSAVIPVRLNRKAINQEITYNVLAFIMIYMSVFATGVVVMSWIGVDFETAIGSVATSLGNIGPGLGSVGPVDNFSHLPGIGKWFLSFLMLMGRLELFTVMMLFTPYFWRRY
ncbi:TrkH family potassium uptake protein [Fulvivirgaceae bacterium BMA10]|uniref:TrkH family potassium uptake protein n=1 Tax=Splendidivirga corallicola TaxID=3051826 RepID=A0ABT8KWP7_9BACT|nr:TrkH family potassium uptake protein [Fulvivirgaceae bacterium BMA10]